MSITILNPGMLTSVQDLGRIGYQQYGVSVSGVMDPRSASIANILVDNDEGEAVLECTMMGPHLRFDAPNIIAITGGDLGATLDGQSIDTYRAVPVNAGQTLRFTMLRTGCRAFVAFAGGLDIPLVMGSRSTDMKAKIGGYQGRKLQKDDVIAFRAPKTDLKNLGVRHISPEFVPRAEYKLRVVLGPQDDAFTELGIMTFLSSVYTLTPEFDRMGCRLDGELIEHIKDGNIISDGIAFGAIQVPSAGKPIIMLADRQTTGGYTKIANVISADFRILAQLKAGDRVRFEKVSITTAQEALLAQRAALRCLRGAMNVDAALKRKNNSNRRNDTWPLILPLISIRSRARFASSSARVSSTSQPPVCVAATHRPILSSFRRNTREILRNLPSATPSPARSLRLSGVRPRRTIWARAATSAPTFPSIASTAMASGMARS